MYEPADSDNIVDVLFVSKCDIKQPGGSGNACSITITYIKQHDTPDAPNSTISRDDIVFELDKDGNYVRSNEIENE
jgi:hypothetical protein